MFTQNKRHRISKFVILGAAGIALNFPLPGLTQEQEFGIEEIIVTAQKREQSLQDVPIAVTALNSEALEASRIENVLDLQFNAPNMMINSNRNYTIRGVGTQVYGGSRDAGVGYLVNGVFIQAPEETTEMYDLDRVEVLRGPQGTLMGRNTTGGAMNFITAQAHGEFEASAELQVENNDGYRFNGVINFRLSDSIWQRFSVNTVNRDGYTENLFTGNDIDGRDQQAIRSSTHFEFSDSTSADLVLDYYTEDSTRNFSPKALCLPDPTYVCSPDARATDYPEVNYGITNLFMSNAAVVADKFIENPSDLRKIYMDTEPSHDGDQFIATLEINHDFENFTFTSVTGYQERERDTLRDFDLGVAPNAFIPGDYSSAFGVPFTIADDGNGNGLWTYLEGGETITSTSFKTSQASHQEPDQWSQEFRIASNRDGNLNYLLGVYYLDATWVADVDTWLPSGGTAGSVGGDTDASTESLAFFGELYWDVSDTVQIIAGLRNSEEDKDIRSASWTYSARPDPASYCTADDSFSETTGRFVVNWSPELSSDTDSLFYASYSTGYKAGGFNPGNACADQLESEEVDSIEIGTKNILFDNRLQLNAAVFDYNYDNLTLGAIVDGLARNTNVPESSVTGAELELIYLPTEEWRLESALGFLDTEIDSNFLTADASRNFETYDLKGNELPNSPDMTVKLAAQYSAEFGDGWWVTPRVDYYWQDEFFTREYNTGADTVDSWSVVDLRVSFGKVEAPWDVTLFVKNIGDENDITHVETNSNLVGSFKSIFLLDPRTYAVAFRYRWD